jgi:hypothetical protein
MLSLKQQVQNDPEGAGHSGEAECGIEREILAAIVPAHHSSSNSDEPYQSQDLEYEFCNFQRSHGAALFDHARPGDRISSFSTSRQIPASTRHIAASKAPDTPGAFSRVTCKRGERVDGI